MKAAAAVKGQEPEERTLMVKSTPSGVTERCTCCRNSSFRSWQLEDSYLMRQRSDQHITGRKEGHEEDSWYYTSMPSIDQRSTVDTLEVAMSLNMR